MAITDATNASPIVITSPTNGLQTGDHVVISGVLGNTAANNADPNSPWTITVLPGGGRFSLDGSNGKMKVTQAAWAECNGFSRIGFQE
jgi:hypothetical protein